MSNNKRKIWDWNYENIKSLEEEIEEWFSFLNINVAPTIFSLTVVAFINKSPGLIVVTYFFVVIWTFGSRKFPNLIQQLRGLSNNTQAKIRESKIMGRYFGFRELLRKGTVFLFVWSLSAVLLVWQGIWS